MSGDTYGNTYELDTDGSGLTLGRYLVIYVNVTDTTNTTKILFSADVFSSMTVDDDNEVELSTSYLFTTTGSHKVRLKMKENFIKANTFYACTLIKTIIIPDSVKIIEDWTFQQASSLSSITMPNSVTSIGNSAFYYCTSLTSIVYQGTTTQWNNITKKSNWHSNVPSTTVVTCTDGTVALD